MSHSTACRERFATLAELMPVLNTDASRTWLSSPEQDLFRCMVNPRRRLLWLAGRHLTKSLLCEVAGEAAAPGNGARWHIDSRDALNRAIRPRVYRHGRLLPWTLSISHGQGALAVALATDPNLSVGVDVTPMERTAPGFAEFWFTPAEQDHCLRSNDPWCGANIWAVKEAAYKAANRGEPFAPRQWQVEPGVGGDYLCPGVRVRVRRRSGHITALAMARREEVL